MLDRSSLKPTIVDLEEHPEKKSEVLVHDSSDPSGLMGTMYADMAWPEFPIPTGVFRRREKPTYDGMVADQLDQARAKSGEADLKKLLFSGDMWEVS